MSYLEFQKVSFAYAEHMIFSDLSFGIEKGESIALLGDNGAGKSTLLRILNGILSPSAGRYLFEGVEITPALLRAHKESKSFHQKIGFIWQNPDSQLFCPSVYEELAFAPLQMGFSQEICALRVKEAAQLLQIEQLLARAPYTLSGGEKKKVAIASILTMNPSVWTLDEPLAALDKNSQAFFLDFLCQLKAAGKTLIFSSHDDDLVEKIADRVISLPTGDSYLLR